MRPFLAFFLLLWTQFHAPKIIPRGPLIGPPSPLRGRAGEGVSPLERGARGDGQKKGKRVQGKTTARFFPLKERDILKRCTLFREGNVWKGVHPVRLDGACDLRDWEGRVVSRIGTPTGRGTCAYEVNGASGKRMEERAIGEAFHNKTPTQYPNRVRGTTHDGVTIEIWLDRKGHVDTAYPIYDKGSALGGKP